ncbi:MAG: imidazole glycerol phosphate synthase subunit HisF [Nitrospirae bacterium]|nr:imidazole glycerol phosphate synthase subunit HisF [Nitrospirota bacterium]
MSNNVRIIPRLDIKGTNVVKGVHFEGLRVVGRPETMSRIYYVDGADELIYIDSVASLYGRNNIEKIVRKAANDIYIPLTVGGGIRSIEDIRRLLRAGADKIAINTAAINDPQLITAGARAFGSQCIVISIQAKKRALNKYECLTDNARETTGLDVIQWAKKVVELGAGEILLTSVDNDGTGKGYDIDLVCLVTEVAEVPVIACGGAGNKEHLQSVVLQGHADAVCAASIFHYALLDQTGCIDCFEEGVTDFLKKNLPIAGHFRRNIIPISISNVKNSFIETGINVRIVGDKQNRK